MKTYTELTTYQRFLQSVLMRVRPSVLAAALKPLLGVRRVPLETPHGIFSIDPVSVLGWVISRDGVHELGMVQTLEQCLKEGGSFVDLGANEGYFTAIGAGLCGAHGRVIAIEPQVRLLPVIEENLKLNKVSNATLMNVAVGDVSGPAVMHLAATTNTGGSGFHRVTKYRLPTQEVRMMTLEQVLDECGMKTVDLLKVDIEGYEHEAILGSRRVFQEHRVRALALELHPEILRSRGKDSRDIEHLLEGCGYQCELTFGNAVWRAPA